VSLTARFLEANRIPTIIMGSAKDIVEYCGVPRFVFSDFPLGNSAGKPHDRASQSATLELALRVLESAPAPRTTVQSPQRWPGSAEWKLDFQNVDRMPPEELQRRRSEFDEIKRIGQRVRDETMAIRAASTGMTTCPQEPHTNPAKRRDE